MYDKNYFNIVDFLNSNYYGIQLNELMVVYKTWTVTDLRTRHGLHKTTDQSTNRGPKYKTRTNGSIFTN